MIDYTRTLNRLLPPVDGDPTIQHRAGIVDTVNGDGTVDVDFGGTVVTSVSVLDGAALAVADTVQVASWRGDLIVLGRTRTQPVDILGLLMHDNLIPNAGWETQLDFPHVVFDAGGACTWTVGSTPGVALDGEHYMVFDNSGGQTSNSRYMLRGHESTDAGRHIPVYEGMQLYFGFWVHLGTGAQNRVRSRSEMWSYSAGHQGGAGTSAWATPTGSWAEVSHETIAMTAGVEYVVFDIEVEDSGHVCTIYFDRLYAALTAV